MIIKNGFVFVHDGYFQKADILFEDRIIAINRKAGDVVTEHISQDVRTEHISQDARTGCISQNVQAVYTNQDIGTDCIPQGKDLGRMRTSGIGCAVQKAEIDAAGKYVIPGLVDIHSHGAVNEDASDGSLEGIIRMAHFYASRGITSWCPTTMSLAEHELTGAMRTIRAYADLQDGIDELHASCVGIHLEGPFLNKVKKGAQGAEYMAKPDAEMFRRLHEASGGLVRMVTVAPEEDEGCSFIREVSGICTISLGHSAADYNMASRAFEAGASHVTHMFNGMNGIHHRNPGLIGAAFDAGVSVELILDGLHILPSVIRMAERMFTDHITLISDSMRSTGMPDGVYSLGGQTVNVKKGKAALEDGTLAGSSITLMDALRNAVKFGIPLERAVRYATSIPASVIGVDTYLGKIREGYQADMLILDRDLNLETVIKKGKVYSLQPLEK